MEKEEEFDFNDEDLFETNGPTVEEANALVSKWLESSDDQASDGSDFEQDVSNPIVPRAHGVGLGAEDLNDLLAQKRLDPIERKMKYRMEASKAWKEKREKEALEAMKRLEDDVLDLESKSNQFSKKRNRTMSKTSQLEYFASSSKFKKTSNGTAVRVPNNSKQSNDADSEYEQDTTLVSQETIVQSEEVVFDFSVSKTTTNDESSVHVSKQEKSKSDTKRESNSKASKHTSSPNHKSKDKKHQKEKSKKKEKSSHHKSK